MYELTLTNNININIPNAVQNKANQILEKNEQFSNDERFYYQNSPDLRNLMININLLLLVN